MKEKVLAVFFGGLYLIIAISMLSRCLSVQGGGMSFDLHGLKPAPHYGFKYLPADRPGIDGTMTGADFSQVYFAAQALQHGESAYRPTTPRFRDPFNRLPNYPPLTNQLYRLLSFLPYPAALALHNYGSLLLLVAATAYALGSAGLGRFFPHVTGAYLLLYFYSPLGVLHMERGQFDLFVAVSYLMMYLILFRQYDTSAAVISGLTGAVKWSSFPFLGTFGILLFAAGDSRKRRQTVLVSVILLLSIVLFLPSLREYWASLGRYELHASATGITYMSIMPKPLAKSFQAICAALVVSAFLTQTEKASRPGALSALSFPFALAMAIQGLCFGTISYEYRVVSFLGLIPAAALWLQRADRLSPRFRTGFGLFFSIFLVIAFRMLDLDALFPADDAVVPMVGADSGERTVTFHTFAMLSVLACLYICRKVSGAGAVAPADGATAATASDPP